MAGEEVGRTYTKAQLQSVLAGLSGASRIGVSPVTGLSAADVQQALDELARGAAGGIPAGGTTNQFLAKNADGSLSWRDQVFYFPPFTDPSDPLTAPKTGVNRLPISEAGTLLSVKAMVGVAPVGQGIILSVKKNGAQVATVTIAAGATVGTTGNLTEPLAIDDYLTIDITQVGTTTPGSYLTVMLKWRR